MPGVPLIREGLGGGHQGLADRKLRHAVGLAGLIDKPYQFLPYIRFLRGAGAIHDGGDCWGAGANGERQGSALSSTVGSGDVCGSLRFGDSYPKA